MSISNPSPVTFQQAIPEMFICPISMEIMKEPQISKCGHMFDKSSIVKWLKGDYDPDQPQVKRQCPVCHKELDLNSLGPCYPIKYAIEEFLKNPNGIELQDKTSSESNNTTASNHSLQSQQSRQSQQSGISFESQGTNRSRSFTEPITDNDRRPRSSSSMSRFKDSILKKIGGDSSKKGKKKVWCTLTPVVQGTFDKIFVFRDDFQIGRNPSADHVIKLQEVSHFHCRIRRRRQAGGKYEILVEDGSTNGTFVNGVKVGKSNLHNIYHGDCLSIGRKFLVEKDVPVLKSWIDWVFLGSSDLQEHPSDIELLKSIDRFDTLLQFHESDYGKLGIVSESVMNTVLLALKAWRYDHRFPCILYLSSFFSRSNETRVVFKQSSG
eukprot:NODE_48_length_31852_cov_1.054168.p12 type:complete len:380 gc:universal NODE_48_length_31852_cov_1.054168:18035-16896(-)